MLSCVEYRNGFHRFQRKSLRVQFCELDNKVAGVFKLLGQNVATTRAACAFYRDGYTANPCGKGFSRCAWLYSRSCLPTVWREPNRPRMLPPRPCNNPKPVSTVYT